MNNKVKALKMLPILLLFQVENNQTLKKKQKQNPKPKQTKQRNK